MTWVRRVLRRAKCIARTVRDVLCPEVMVIAGSERYVGELLSICHAGGMPRNYRLGFPGQVLREIEQEIDLGRHWLWKLRTLARAHNCSFLLVESPLILRTLVSMCLGARSGSYFLPFFVSATCDIADMNKLLRKNENLKSDIRRIRREKFWYRVSTDPKDYRRFLDEYHRPYLMAAHGSFAMLFDYSFLCRYDEALLERWELIQVMVGGDWVAGVIMRKSKGRAEQFESGVRDADLQAVKRGALAATYWFGVQRAKELGYSTVSFMWAPPFLGNGVLRMKSKYRPKLEAAPSTRSGAVFIPLNKNPATYRILINQPFIQLQGGELKATCLVNHPRDVEEARKRLSQDLGHFRGIPEYEILPLDQPL